MRSSGSSTTSIRCDTKSIRSAEHVLDLRRFFGWCRRPRTGGRRTGNGDDDCDTRRDGRTEDDGKGEGNAHGRAGLGSGKRDRSRGAGAAQGADRLLTRSVCTPRLDPRAERFAIECRDGSQRIASLRLVLAATRRGLRGKAREGRRGASGRAVVVKRAGGGALPARPRARRASAAFQRRR